MLYLVSSKMCLLHCVRTLRFQTGSHKQMFYSQMQQRFVTSTHNAGGLHSGRSVDGVSKQAVPRDFQAHDSSNHRARVDSCH
jgi:hypothetical protein